MAETDVLYEVSERIATITMNRPEARNALSTEVLELLPGRMTQAEADPDVDVMILTVEPVGNYAIRIGFDDMHSTGIFTWAYFRELADEKDQRWQAYLDELQAKGLSREPRRR